LTQLLTEMSTRSVRRADNLTTFMCRLSWNLGASTSWNPQGLSRPVMGLLCFYVRVLYPEQATVLSNLDNENRRNTESFLFQ